jgi:hypothetical protein
MTAPVTPTPQDQISSFSGTLVAAIELLKHGAPIVDMHEFGIRLRRAGKTWAVYPIPAHATQAHAEIEFDDQMAAKPAPIDGAEGRNDQTEGAPAEVGAAPANA